MTDHSLVFLAQLGSSVMHPLLRQDSSVCGFLTGTWMQHHEGTRTLLDVTLHWSGGIQQSNILSCVNFCGGHDCVKKVSIRGVFGPAWLHLCWHQKHATTMKPVHPFGRNCTLEWRNSTIKQPILLYKLIRIDNAWVCSLWGVIGPAWLHLCWQLFLHFCKYSFGHNSTLRRRKQTIKHTMLFYLFIWIRWIKNCFDLKRTWSRRASFVLRKILDVLRTIVGFLGQTGTIVIHFFTPMRESVLKLFDCQVTESMTIHKCVFQGIPWWKAQQQQQQQNVAESWSSTRVSSLDCGRNCTMPALGKICCCLKESNDKNLMGKIPDPMRNPQAVIFRTGIEIHSNFDIKIDFWGRMKWF